MVKEYYPFNFVGEATDFAARLKFSFCELNYVYYTELLVHWRQAKILIYVYISRWNKEKDKPPIKNCWKLPVSTLTVLFFPKVNWARAILLVIEKIHSKLHSKSYDYQIQIGLQLLSCFLHDQVRRVAKKKAL